MTVGVLIVLALITIAVVGLLAVPLLSRGRSDGGRDRQSLAVYRDQLAEVDRDAARGVLGPGEAEAARREIERRIVALDPSPDVATSPARARWTLVAVIVLVPAAAALLYALYGSPRMPDQPLADRWSDDRVVAEGGLTAGQVHQMIARLETKLAADPHDTESWATMAGAYGLLEQYDRAAWAMGQAVELDPGDAERQSLLGEFLVLAAGGIVPTGAADAFDAALAADPKQPVARFYLALARAQSGDVAGALADWQALLADAPADADWTPLVVEQIGHAARQLGMDPAEAVAGSGPSGPSQEDVEAITSLTDDEQIAMIRDMVEGLATRLADEPGNLEGWSRLAQSYAVLGEWDKARDAYAHALSLAPTNRNLADGLANAVSGLLPDDGSVPPESVAAYEAVLHANPDNQQSLYYLGLAAHARGDTEQAIALWTRLRDQLPADSSQYLFIDQRLKEIGGS